MEPYYEITLSEMVEAFTEWERRYREEPEQFWNDVYRFTQTTPDTYGDACAQTFLGYLGL